MFLGSCLNKVLDKSLEAEDDILEALYVLDVTDERAHLTLAFGKLNLAILIPELVATHHGVYILNLLLSALEQLTGQFIEGIVVDAGVTYHCQLLQEEIGKEVKKGVFGANMQVALVNDGPVTIIIDSRIRE